MKLFESTTAKRKKAVVKHMLEESRYQREGTLGRGGIGKVEQHFDKTLQRLVAVKSLHENLKDNPKQLRSLLNEARLTAYLQHPGIVPVYDASIDEEYNLSYSMQMIEGDELTSLLETAQMRGSYLPIATVLSIFTKVCETLAYVHDKGVLHLDLKPDNIMLGAYGEVQIVDWGNAQLFAPESYLRFLRSFGYEERIDTFKHEEGVVSGTPPYMPLEQFTSPRDELTPASDIFALGVILYYMLTHKHPFPFEGDVATYFEALKEATPKPPKSLRGDLPQSLDSICMKMLHKEPSERFKSANELLSALKSFSDTGAAFATKTYKHGEVIFRQGETGDYAFLILSGYVEIYAEIDGERKFLSTRGEGDVVGELAVFTKEPRAASVKAIVPTTIKILKEKEIELELNNLSPWVGQIIHSLSIKFRDFTQRYAEKL